MDYLWQVGITRAGGTEHYMGLVERDGVIIRGPPLAGERGYKLVGKSIVEVISAITRQGGTLINVTEWEQTMATTRKPKQPTQRAPAPVEGGNEMENATMQGTDAVVVNWAAAKGDYDSPITPGDHVGVLIEKEYNPSSKSSGQPTMKLTWKIPALNDRKISRYYSLQPKALWGLRQAMVAHGASPEVMNAENANLFDTINSVIESQAVLEIALQAENPEYNEVKKVKPLSSLK